MHDWSANGWKDACMHCFILDLEKFNSSTAPIWYPATWIPTNSTLHMRREWKHRESYSLEGGLSWCPMGLGNPFWMRERWGVEEEKEEERGGGRALGWRRASTWQAGLGHHSAIPCMTTRDFRILVLLFSLSQQLLMSVFLACLEISANGSVSVLPLCPHSQHPTQ